jgi:hypothetical protein
MLFSPIIRFILQKTKSGSEKSEPPFVPKKHSINLFSFVDFVMDDL